MNSNGIAPVPVPPAECRTWCRAQHPAVVLADEYVPVDLDRWNEGLRTLGVDVRLRAGGADGGVVDRGVGHLCRGDLWAAGRRAAGSVEEAVVALYMCAAWLSSHPTRSGIRRGVPDFRLHHADPRRTTAVTDEGFPVVLHDVTDWLDTPREAMSLLRHGAPHGSGPFAVPGLGTPLASLYLSAVSMAHGRGDLVPVDPAGIATLVNSGWTAVTSLERLTPRRYEMYVELIGRWAEEAEVDPLLVEMWLVERWHERARTHLGALGDAMGRPPGGAGSL